jgi:hypothetical protein
VYLYYLYYDMPFDHESQMGSIDKNKTDLLYFCLTPQFCVIDRPIAGEGHSYLIPALKQIKVINSRLELYCSLDA